MHYFTETCNFSGGPIQLFNVFGDEPYSPMNTCRDDKFPLVLNLDETDLCRCKLVATLKENEAGVTKLANIVFYFGPENTNVKIGENGITSKLRQKGEEVKPSLVHICL